MSQRTWLLAGTSALTSNIAQAVGAMSDVETSIASFNQASLGTMSSDDLIVFRAGQIGELFASLKTLADKGTRNGGSSGRPSIQLNMSRMTATYNDQQSVPLTSREFQILSVIHANAPGTSSRDQIVASVWGSMHVTPKAFDVHLVSLRRKLKSLGIKIQYSAPCQYRIEVDAAAARGSDHLKATA